MSIFVDNIKIMGAKNSVVINQVKTELTAIFEMVDIRSISFYFSLKVNRDYEREIIKLFQPAYIDKILSKFYLAQSNTSNMPMRESSLIPNKREATMAE